jgi:hypothetical protein
MRFEQLLLALDADLVEHDVARVAQQLLIIHYQILNEKRPQSMRPLLSGRVAMTSTATARSLTYYSFLLSTLAVLDVCTGRPFKWLSACAS